MDKRIRALIACPFCKNDVVIRGSTSIRCNTCNKKFPIKRGIPIFLDSDLLTDQLNKQIEYFSDEVTSYAGTFQIVPWQQKFISSLLGTSNTWKNKIVLDDACGSGYMTIAAAKRGAFVIACDINLSALMRIQRIAIREGVQANVSCVCCSAENLPLKRAIVNAVSANAILEHLPKDFLAVEEIARVCKHGAMALITVPLAYKYLNPLFLLPNYIHDLKIGHLRRYTKESLTKLFRDWKIKNIFYSGHTKKAIKLLINSIVPVFNLLDIENDDLFYKSNKWFASNLTILFIKKK